MKKLSKNSGYAVYIHKNEDGQKQHVLILVFFFLQKLALTDLIVGTLVMPFNIKYKYYNHHWLSSKLLCHVWILSDVIAQTASIWSLVVIAIDRWLVSLVQV